MAPGDHSRCRRPPAFGRESFVPQGGEEDDLGPAKGQSGSSIAAIAGNSFQLAAKEMKALRIGIQSIKILRQPLL